MTKIENLLVTLSEECAEVQQAVSKVLRFGKNNYNSATPQPLIEFHKTLLLLLQAYFSISHFLVWKKIFYLSK